MILVVAEKPSVGRDIARVLKCTSKGEGFLQGDMYTVTWAVGHLVTLCEPQEIDEKYKKWRMEDLPILPEDIPTKVISKTKSQYNVIRKLMLDKDTQRIVCATDAGREGELIFRLIYEKSGCGKPVDRLWISSMTDIAIKEGFDTLKPASVYDGLYRSASSRSQADWLVGMNASRAFTLRYNALLSVGRVQTPTLAILVQREKEIREFVPEEYFTLLADFGDYTGLWFDETIPEEKLNIRIKTQELAQSIASEVRKKSAKIISVSREGKRELPPSLYDLTTLQRDANKTLGFTASKTLKVAQSLYETRKAITYPRTDSRYLPDDMASRVPKTLSNLPEAYASFIDGIPKPSGKLPHSKRIYDNTKVSDHHAIIPTPQRTDTDKLDKDEQALFDLIARRLIAALYPVHEYDAIRVITSCQTHKFKTTGRNVTQLGWKALYPPKKEEAESSLPSLAQGDKRTLQNAKVKKETTKAPPWHTDASLLSAMENAGREIEDEDLKEQMKGSGLGTPATRAAIIDRLVQVGYVQRKGKIMQATPKGEKLIAAVPPDIASPEMTGKWEKALSEIAENKRDVGRFMDGIRRLTQYLVTYSKENQVNVEFERETRGTKGRKKGPASLGVSCPVCGKPLQETDKAFGCSAWRDGCKFTLWKNALSRSNGPMLTARIVKSLLDKGEVKGSTGLVQLKDGKLTFTPAGQQTPALAVDVLYEKKSSKKT